MLFELFVDAPMPSSQKNSVLCFTMQQPSTNPLRGNSFLDFILKRGFVNNQDAQKIPQLKIFVKKL